MKQKPTRRARKILDAVSIARYAIVKHQPYFASEVFGSVYIETAQVPTAAVSDRMVIYYNPEFMGKITQEQANFVIWHEIQHPLRKHHMRLKGVDPTLANIAKDLAINTHARHLPQGAFDASLGYLPSVFKFPEDLTAEEYLDLLRKHMVKIPLPTMFCNGGSGSSDGEYPWETSEDQGRSESDMRGIHGGTASAIQASDEKTRGSVAGDLLEWAAAITAPPKVHWKDKLRDISRITITQVRAAREGDSRTFAKPHRKTYRSASGFVFPSRAETVPDIYLVLDTSGSMSMREFGPALREMQGILSALGMQKCWLVQADADVADVRQVSARDLLNIQLKGRGGTCFIPAIEHAVEKGASIIVYFTDGYGTAPAEPPKVPVIWVLVGGSTFEPAPWGKYVVVDD